MRVDRLEFRPEFVDFLSASFDLMFDVFPLLLKLVQTS